MADKHINIKLGTKFDGGGISSALRSLKRFARGATDIKSAFGMVSGAITRAFSGVKSIVGSAFKFETQTTQFKTLIGNIDDAKAHMADLKALGETPPFSLDQFAAASRSLMVMTDGALGYKKSLEMIGDAAAATGQPIEEMGHAVGRLFAVIRDGQPISRATMQLRNMGVITPEVAARLDDMQKSGASALDMWREVENALAKYNGAMKETEQTGDGLAGAIKSRWDNIVRSFGEAFADTAKDGMGSVLDRMKELEEDGSLVLWAEKSGECVKAVADAFKSLAPVVSGLWKSLVATFDAAGSEIGRFAGAISMGKFGDAFGGIGKETARAFTEAFDLDGVQAKKDAETKLSAAKKIAEKKREAELKAAERAAEEQKRIEESLAEGQRKVEERNAQDAAEKRADAEKKAAQEAAKERDRLDRELHQKRMADLRDEIAAQKEAAASLDSVASAAQSEFDRAFAMYRDPERAAEQIAEERDYAADLKRLHRDASRYAGKWRIDELSNLMSTGDTQAVQARLEEWRKSKRFTPEVESMVRASAAEQAKTTAEDELRKLNDKTAELTQKMDQLAQSRDGKLDGIERNTNQLANKLDELLTVKG